MPRKQTSNFHYSRVAFVTFLALAFFAMVAFKFRFAEFRFSILELMLLLLSMFTLAVAVTYWKIIHPVVQKLGRKKMDEILRI